MTHKQIIALGGGGFSMEPGNLLLDRYVLDQSEASTPTICFLPTASGDSSQYIVNYYAAYTQLDCTPSHVPLFNRTPDLRAKLLSQDIIFVGGGNTKSMLAVWREWELPDILREAWDAVGLSRASPTRARTGWLCWTVWDFCREAVVRISTGRKNAGPRIASFWRRAKSSPATRWTTEWPCILWVKMCAASCRRGRRRGRIGCQWKTVSL
jgi:hypothetical protein